MAYHTQIPTSSRAAGVGFVVVLHIAIIFFLVKALEKTDFEIPVGPFKVDLLQDVQNPDEAPPPPPPALEKPPPDFVPPPEVSFDLAPTTNSNAITAVTNTQNVPPQSDKRHPNARPDYPEASVRLGEEGSVILAIYVTPQGSVSDSKVEKSSGFARLDDAAQRASLRYHFIPGQQGGQAAAMWHRIKITFRLCEEKQTRCN